ncbi:MAG: DUF2207 domain-containing protein [Pseudomonadaceae bacterium]|nr:DUF2207 domain-containing protein [Pseudomonadaceae bacterium]
MSRLLIGLLLSLLCLPALATERGEVIEDFAVEVEVQRDGSLLVSERITVQARGEQIRRGIYRDFPVRSRLAGLLDKRVGFELLEVRRDGEPEPHFQQPQGAMQRVYIGREDLQLAPGRYQYLLRYRSDRQLLQRPGEDELYWNVTGNDWAFPILRASVRVHLPAGAEVLAAQGYTGWAGEQGGDYRRLDDELVPAFATTRELQPGEGFTIALAWRAGLVQRPGTLQRLAWLLADNLGGALGLGLLALLLGFYGYHWHRVGRDPEAGVVIARFAAPEGLSPAATGFIWHRGFERGYSQVRALTVALTSMAIKRAVRLEDLDAGKGFAVHRGEADDKTLFSGERQVLASLLKGDIGYLEIARRYEPRLGEAVAELAKLLHKEQHERCFRLNRGLWWQGVLIALVGIVACLVLGAQDSDGLALIGAASLFMVCFGGAGLFVIGSGVRGLLEGQRAGGLGMVLFGLPFFAVGLGAMAMMAGAVAPLNLLLVLALVLCCALFRVWLEAPTLRGRQLLDEIAGYREYLSLAERDELAGAGKAPAMSIALYERHLPYAMALGVEKEWSARFTRALAAGLVEAGRSDYRPDWYRSERSFVSPEQFSSRLSSGLAGIAASAASPPSSSSSSGGSSGGGSSGGGGGGGGGGGW